MSHRNTAAQPSIGDSPITQKAIPRHAEQLGQFREIVFWEENDPKSLVNLVTDRMRELMRQLPPELLGQSEKELRRRLDPTWLQDQLRLAFWDEYFLTIDNNQNRMRPGAIFANCCSKETFYTQIENPLFLAFLTKPPAGYMLKMRSLLDMALERMREILTLDLTNPNGTVNTKLIAEIVKIAALADNRVKGAVTQKIQIDQTSKNLHVTTNYEPPKTHQDLDKELKDIENQILQLKEPQAQPNYFESTEEHDVIEVTASTTET